MSLAARGAESAPQWLQALLNRNGQPPRLFAWSPANLHDHHHGDATVPGLASKRPTPSYTPSDLERRIFIVGIGNLGRLFATSLAGLDNRPPITLVVHKKALLTEWLYRPGLEITRGDTAETSSDFDIEWWTDEPPGSGPPMEVADGLSIRNLLITTKASDALPQVDRLRRYLSEQSTVAFAQNGMCKMWPPLGPAYVAARYTASPTASHPNWLACVTTHGVTSKGTFKSVHASQADVAIGPVMLNPATASYARYLSSLIAAAPHLDGKGVSRADLWILQLEKLVVNAIINPLTAILHCKNGKLFEDGPGGPIAQVMDLLLEEASSVLRALVEHDSSAGMLLLDTASSTSESPAADLEPTRRQELLHRFSAPRLRKMLYHVGYKVRDNTSSMLQDILAGKRTEVRDFNGWLVDTAAWLDRDITVTSHKTLIGLVEAGDVLEAGSLGRYFPQIKRRDV